MRYVRTGIAIVALAFASTAFTGYAVDPVKASGWVRVDDDCPEGSICEKTRCYSDGTEQCEAQYCTGEGCEPIEGEG
jgi:hypothetical protein